MKRAMDDRQKEVRRRAILDSALTLMNDSDGHLSTVAEIARKSGIAKGTIYLYFRTREEIYLELFREFIDAWFERLNQTLKKQPESIDTVISAICSFLADNPAFMRLASAFNAILEKNINPETAYEFKLFLKNRVTSAGTTISEVLPLLSHELAVKLILRSFALCVGLWQIAEPAPVLKQLHNEKSDLDLLSIDFISEATSALAHLWTGAMSYG